MRLKYVNIPASDTSRRVYLSQSEILGFGTLQARVRRGEANLVPSGQFVFIQSRRGCYEHA